MLEYSSLPQPPALRASIIVTFNVTFVSDSKDEPSCSSAQRAIAAILSRAEIKLVTSAQLPEAGS